MRHFTDETRELCLILSGLVEITEEGCEPVRCKAGACSSMNPGYIGTWRTIETVRKVWIMA